MTRPQALIFDVDGTLAETERDGHRLAFNQAFADAGLSWHWDVPTYGRLLAITGGKERMLHWWNEIDPAGAALPGAAELIAELHRRKTALYVDLIAQGGIGLRPGVLRLLDEAQDAGLTVAIATTTTPENVDALLRATLGAAGNARFASIGAGDIVPRKKPDPGIYTWVLQRLGLEPDQAMAFEDSANGLRAALGAGLRTVVTTGAYTHDEVFPEGAVARLDGLGEPGQPARGRVRGEPWSGAVDLAALRDWA